MASVTQFNFSGGEITPELHGNTGLDKYRTSLKTLTNVTVKKTGGLQNRPGTEFVCPFDITSLNNKLIPFIFSDSQTYVLRFTNGKINVIKEGALLYNAGKAITGASKANPCVITCVAHGYSTGDIVYISGISGMTQLNNRWFHITNTGANTFTLQDVGTAGNINSISYSTYTSGGTSKKVYEIDSPYVSDDIPDIQFSQSGDIITLAHQNYAPRELSRTGDTSWTLSTIDFEPEVSEPTNLASSGGAAGSDTFYCVTAIDDITGEESLAGFGASLGSQTITGITRANPGVFTTSAAHGIGARLPFAFITGVSGMTEVNNLREYMAVSTGANTFQLQNYFTGDYLDTTSFTAYTSGGTFNTRGTYLVGTNPTSGAPVSLSWDLTTGARKYRIYRNPFGVNIWRPLSLIGEVEGGAFSDNGITGDTTDLLPLFRNPFSSANNYPKVVAHAQQRIFYANTINNPETFWGSKTGCYHNFITRSTISDGDPVTGTLANRKVNQINHLVDLERLVCLLAGSEVTLNGSQSGFVTPDEVNAKTQSYNGSSDLRPVLMDESVLYIQNRGSYIRELSFVGETYAGTDLSIFAKHLFEGYTITDWSFQENPDSIIWAVRSDGVLLSLTYVKAQNIIAWAKHTFRYGIVENVCVVPHGTEDKVYLIIKRSINNISFRYLEFLSNRFISDIKDNIFMDSALSTDGTNTASTTMTLSGSGWTYLDTLTLTASAGFFVSGDIGNEIHLTGSDGTLIRCEITAYTSATVVSVRPDRTVPASMQATAISTWGKAVDEISGLWHLEGKPVSVLGDGFVVASPYNSDYSTLTVTNGAITLPRPYAVIHVGLPYISDIETLDIDAPNIETLSTKKILITEVTARVYKTKGLWFGREAPSDDDTDALEGLTELKLRSNESMDDPVALKTGVIDTIIETKWSEGGRVFLRQVDPLPLTLISLTPSGIIPAGG